MKVKGTAIRGLVQAIESLKGKEALDRVKAQLTPRMRETIEKISPLSWYPVETSGAIHAAVRDVLGGGTWDVSHDLGKEAARIEFTGIYKVLIRAVQYDTVWDRMELAWKNYADSGEAKWFERGDGFARAYISGVAGYNPGMWSSIAGRCEGMLMLSGAKGASVTVVESASTHCRIEAMWLT